MGEAVFTVGDPHAGGSGHQAAVFEATDFDALAELAQALGELFEFGQLPEVDEERSFELIRRLVQSSQAGAGAGGVEGFEDSVRR